MNQRLQGWKLALALLIPAAIIGAAGFIAYGALSDDTNQVAVSDEQPEVEATPTVEPTPLPETAPVAEPVETTEETPTAIPLPTPEPTATVDPASIDDLDDEEEDTDEADPEPAATSAPAPAATSAPAPAATAAPAPAPTSGPAPTATPDPDVITVACSGDIPASVGVGEQFGPLTAVLSPPEAGAGVSYFWDFGNNRNAGSPGSGGISYSAPGSYTITLTANDSATATAVATTTCGTVTVAAGVESIAVTCAVSARDGLALDAARPGDFVTVTISWEPDDVLLNLQYEYEVNDDIVIANGSSSGATQEWNFQARDGSFDVFWRDPITLINGRVSCLAYPGAVAEDAEDGVNADPTPEPTATAEAEVDTDGDGLADNIDAFPNDPAETNDTDGDGIGNNADTDDDGDGVADTDDAAPLDPAVS